MCGQHSRGENDRSHESSSAGEAMWRRDRSSKRFIPQAEFRSPRFFDVHMIRLCSFESTFPTNGGIPAIRNQSRGLKKFVPRTALLFQGKGAHEIVVPSLSASRSCHSYLIAAGVPGGSGRGSTSTMPCATRTR
jgi:hypothetical protein